MSRRFHRTVATLVAAGSIAACSSATAGGHTTTSTALSTSTTTSSSSTTTSTSTSSSTTSSTTTTIAATTTTVSLDLSYADIPIGTCDTIADGAIGFRNDTGNLANAYERIGNSSQGRTIWAEHWGSFDGPQVLVIGQEHGDECAPAWFVRAIRERPPTTFGIWLVPTANPDGLAAHTRRTADDVDPNRDGFRLATPEASAVMYATDRFQPVLSIHVHSPYQWIGSHNDGLSILVGQAMSDAVGWGPIYRAGRVENGDLAFLWEGQELIIPGHQSVLIEFPAVTEAESPAPPDPSQKDVANVAIVDALAVAMRDAFYLVMGG